MSTGVRRADFSPEVEPIEFGLSTARPSTPRTGRVRFETDTAAYVYYDGSSWLPAHVSAEQVQDTVGAMFTGNTETGIAVTYQDADGTIDAELDLNGLTTESAPALTDYVPIVDVSDSNASNKTLLTDLLKLVYPVESIYLSYTSTNPNTTFGFGTWSQIAQGEALVGFKTSDTPFGTLGSIGSSGTKTHTLTTTEMPAHAHTMNAMVLRWATTTTATAAATRLTDIDGITGAAGTTANLTATMQNAGSGGAHNNIQPSYVVYVWRRTA